MYYPYLRGKQNELLAIKELLSDGRLSRKVVPVIEPVKLSPTLVNTLELFTQKQHPIAFIWNPQVGSFSDDKASSKNARYLDRLKEIISSTSIIHAIIINNESKSIVSSWCPEISNDDCYLAICNSPDNIKYYEESFPFRVKTLIPYSSSFRRIRGQRVLLEDKFNKLPKNADYQTVPDEFFSDDHLYYSEEGFVGFSDYSIIGEKYDDAGFAPYAVAIHIVYFDSDRSLRVHHFISQDNDDISDPANKFYQALEQLVRWNKTMHIETKAMEEFEKIYRDQSYPGLGVVKKISLMNHFELISCFLDGKR